MNRNIKAVVGTVVATAIAILLGAAVMPVQGSASSAVTANEPITQGWTVKNLTTSEGRAFFARVPSCEPATEQACVDYINEPRPVLLFAHGAGGPEDATSATNGLNYLSLFQANTIFVYPVSLGGTRQWDAGVCCTPQPVDETTYGVQLVQRIDDDYGVNLNRVGVFGVSNGGMLSHRLACDRPDVFKAGASFAGTYTGPCGAAGVKIAQWHGGADPVVPVNGGSVVVGGKPYTFPPATAIGTRMATGTLFSLVVIPGFGHTANATIYRWQINWLTSQFVG